MLHPILTSLAFASTNKNLNAYAQNCFRPSRLARAAAFLRNALHRCYGTGWDGRMIAATSEPPWLKAVWRWCGVQFLGFDKIRTPRIASCFTKQIVRDPDGTWWCETTYKPPAWASLDIRKLIMDNALRDCSVPGEFIQIIGGASNVGKSATIARAIDMEARRSTRFPLVVHDYAAVERKVAALIAEGQLAQPKVFMGVDWGNGPDHSAVVAVRQEPDGGKAVVFGMPVRIVSKGVLSDDTAVVVGGRPPVPGDKIDPAKFVIIKQRTPKPTDMSNTSILILRRADLLPFRDVPFNEIDLRDFRQTKADHDAATDIVFIDGTRQNVFKSSFQPEDGKLLTYKASGCPERASKVVNDVLVCVVEADKVLGRRAGTLICQPWTDDDNLAADLDDDVMGATVSRSDDAGVYRKFHDQGVFLPSEDATAGDDSDEAVEAIPSDAHLVDDPVTDGRISELEGWGMFNVDSTGLMEIERDDEAAVFADDAAAVEFVRLKAGSGSPYHVKAIEIHDRDLAELEDYRGRSAPPEAEPLPLNSRLLLQLAERALNEITNQRGIPGLPGAPAPFADQFSSYELAAAVGKHLRENQGFAVILGYPDSAETYSSTSTASTWEEAVKDVAQQMVDEGAVSSSDELSIVDVMEGLEHATFSNVDRYAVVRFDDKGARILDSQEVQKEDRFVTALLRADSEVHDCPDADIEELVRKEVASCLLLDEIDQFMAWAMPKIRELAARDADDRAAGRLTAYEEISKIVADIHTPKNPG